MTKNAGRVCEVMIRRAMAVFSEEDYRVLETLNLIASQRLAGCIVGSRKVTHHTVDPNVAKSAECVYKLSKLIVTHTQTSHARIDFHMHVDDDAGVRSRLV